MLFFSTNEIKIKVSIYQVYLIFTFLSRSLISSRGWGTKLKMDWANAECLEKEKRLIPRKILESAHIRVNRERCLNLNEGVGVTDVWNGELVCGGEGGGIK